MIFKGIIKKLDKAIHINPNTGLPKTTRLQNIIAKGQRISEKFKKPQGEVNTKKTDTNGQIKKLFFDEYPDNHYE